MELLADARHEYSIGAPKPLRKPREPSCDKENQPQVEGRTLSALCNALSLSPGSEIHRRSCSPDGSNFATKWETRGPSLRSAAVVSTQDDAFSETFDTTWAGREFLPSPAGFLSSTKSHVPAEIFKQSVATPNSKSQVKRPVKQMPTSGIGSNGNVKISKAAPPAKATSPRGLTLDLLTSNFDVPHHMFDHVAPDAKAHIKVSSPHPMSPLAEVTEAYTEAQGGWRLASETSCSDSRHEHFSKTLYSRPVTFESSKHPEIISNKGKTTKIARANCKNSPKHLGQERGRQVSLNPSSTHRLPLPTAPSFLRI